MNKLYKVTTIVGPSEYIRLQESALLCKESSEKTCLVETDKIEKIPYILRSNNNEQEIIEIKLLRDTCVLK